MVKVKAIIDLEVLKEKYRDRYVTPKMLSNDLGVSTKTAGRILAKMERLGMAQKLSSRLYKIE